MTGKAKISNLFISEFKNWFFYPSFSIISRGARGLRIFCQTITSSVARGLRNFVNLPPRAKREAKGILINLSFRAKRESLRYLWTYQLERSERLKKSILTNPGSGHLGYSTVSSGARGWRKFCQPITSSVARGLKDFVNLPPRLKREAQGILSNLSSRAKREPLRSLWPYHLERSERLKGFLWTHQLERSERLKKFMWTNQLERSERVQKSSLFYRLERSEKLK